MLLLIDNYDSFTYNLFQYLSELGENVMVVRNDKISLMEIEKMKPNRIVISPGPSTPLKAGISNDVIHLLVSNHSCAEYNAFWIVIRSIRAIIHSVFACAIC